ncbi:MAG: hypothetical protein J6U86_03330 [Clostridia bacterium]|nr:hypothetical protein [Clostridia bacterium]
MSLSKKRVLCLILACVTVFLCSCGDNTGSVTETETDIIAEDTTVTTEDGDDVTPDKETVKNLNYVLLDSKEKIDECTTAAGMKLSYNAAGYMDVTFASSAKNPYINFVMPSDKLYAKTYPYIAFIVKTNNTSVGGKVHFGTTKDNTYSANASFLHNDTAGWQLIYIYNVGSSGMDSNSTTLNGDYTKLRLAMFDSVSDTNNTYSIKAMGVFSSMEKMKDWAKGLTDKSVLEYTRDELVALNSGLYLGNEFTTPSNEYRPSRYAYSIESDYNKQIALENTNGFGGICSNYAFRADYLMNESEFDKIEAAFVAMKEIGMYGWIYDEFHWPSGKAYGQVLDGNPEYEEIAICQYIVTGSGSTISYTKPADAVKIEYALVKDSSGTIYHIDYTDTSINASAPSGDWKLYVYLREKTSTQTETSDFRTLRSVNKLSLGATQKFIQTTYQKYYDNMPNGFSNVEAFFTDEPAFYYANFSQLMWEDSLPEVYKQMWGIDIWDSLPSLYTGDTVADKLARLRYYETAAKMVTENYYGALADWCEDHGTALSGHLLYTEMLKDHVHRYGGDLINLLGTMQIPGEDLLFIEPAKMMNTDNYGCSFMGMKYVVSAARSFEREHAFVEFNPGVGSTSNSVVLEDPLLYCKGGATIARFMGIDKFSYMNPQNTMNYDQLKQWNEYVGRMNVVLEDAEMTSGVAVFYPIKTVQAYHYAGVKHYSGTYVSEIDAKYNTLCYNLITSGTDFNIINEDNILSATIDNGVMTIGNGSYNVIAVAYSEVMSLECLQKLNDFVQSGGKVLWVGEKPSLADDAAEQSAFNSVAANFAGDTVYNNENICDIIGQYDNVDATFDNLNGEVLVSQYEKDGKTIYFLCNWQKKLKSVTVNLPETAKISVYYPGTGVIEVINSANSCTVSIPAYEGAFIVVE